MGNLEVKSKEKCLIKVGDDGRIIEIASENIVPANERLGFQFYTSSGAGAVIAMASDIFPLWISEERMIISKRLERHPITYRYYDGASFRVIPNVVVEPYLSTN